MLDLVLDCGLFAPVNAGKGNFYQLSGMEPRWLCNVGYYGLTIALRDAVD